MAVPSILIVDDEAPIRTLLTAAFTKAGYNVRTAAGGNEALALCEAERFDAVLSDVIMPVVDGHDVVREVQSRWPATVCVLMSGFDNSGRGTPGECAFLAKPFTPMQAISAVGTRLPEFARV
jgi:DNA-binding NtrC family response regulator